MTPDMFRWYPVDGLFVVLPRVYRCRERVGRGEHGDVYQTIAGARDTLYSVQESSRLYGRQSGSGERGYPLKDDECRGRVSGHYGRSGRGGYERQDQLREEGRVDSRGDGALVRVEVLRTNRRLDNGGDGGGMGARGFRQLNGPFGRVVIKAVAAKARPMDRSHSTHPWKGGGGGSNGGEQVRRAAIRTAWCPVEEGHGPWSGDCVGSYCGGQGRCHPPFFAKRKPVDFRFRTSFVFSWDKGGPFLDRPMGGDDGCCNEDARRGVVTG